MLLQRVGFRYTILGMIGILVIVFAAVHWLVSPSHNESPMSASSEMQTQDPIQALKEALELAIPKQLSIDELYSKADIVAIVKLSGVSESPWIDSFSSDADRKFHSIVVNHLEVLVNLKGKCERQIECLTLKTKSGVFDFQYSEYVTLYQEIEWSESLKPIGESQNERIRMPSDPVKLEPVYLAFLKKRSRTDFEPVSGQRFSARSFFRLIGLD